MKLILLFRSSYIKCDLITPANNYCFEGWMGGSKSERESSNCLVRRSPKGKSCLKSIFCLLCFPFDSVICFHDLGKHLSVLLFFSLSSRSFGLWDQLGVEWKKNSSIMLESAKSTSVSACRWASSNIDCHLVIGRIYEHVGTFHTVTGCRYILHVLPSLSYPSFHCFFVFCELISALGSFHSLQCIIFPFIACFCPRSLQDLFGKFRSTWIEVNSSESSIEKQ